ncbi:RNA polymerase sigma-70 factor [soil metagenome]
MLPTNDQNEKSAFDNLFNEYFKPLCAYCENRFGFEIDDAKDVVHTCFLKLLESDAICFAKISRPYLYHVVTNQCLDLIRRGKLKMRHASYLQRTYTINDLTDNNKIAEYKELQDTINKSIAALPDQMRRVFELSRNEGLKYAEIATTLNISVNTVETQMVRAFSKLRRQLAAYLTVLW